MPLTVDGRPPTPASPEKPRNLALGFDSDAHRAGFIVPTIAVGETVHAELQYPTIGPQGHTITCTVLVEGQQVAQRTERIVP